MELTTNIFCDHCQEDPGYKKGSKDIWNGFQDMDTGEKACIPCRDTHYRKKQQGPHANLYSEMPLIVKTFLLLNPYPPLPVPKKSKQHV